MAIMNSNSSLFVMVVVCLISSVFCQDLCYNHYDDTCKDFEEIVAGKVREWFIKDKTIAASLIRLHFHDCSVRVCYFIFFLFLLFDHLKTLASSKSSFIREEFC